MFNFLTFILDKPYRWLIMLLGFIILDQVFWLASQWLGLEGLQVFMIYMLNTGLFQLFPEDAIVTLINAFIFVFTMELLFDVLGHQHLPNHQATSRASGFSSRSV